MKDHDEVQPRHYRFLRSNLQRRTSWQKYVSSNSVSGNGVLHAGVEDILDRIRTAERPVEITFSRREQQ